MRPAPSRRAGGGVGRDGGCPLLGVAGPHRGIAGLGAGRCQRRGATTSSPSRIAVPMPPARSYNGLHNRFGRRRQMSEDDHLPTGSANETKAVTGPHPARPFSLARPSGCRSCGHRGVPAMHVEERPIGSIRPYENNPRLNDAAVDAVAASIQRVRLPPAHRRGRAGRHHRRPHPLQGGPEAGAGNRPGPRRRRADSRPGQGVPPRRQPDRHAVALGLRPAARRAGRAEGDELRPRPARLLRRGACSGCWNSPASPRPKTRARRWTGPPNCRRNGGRPRGNYG